MIDVILDMAGAIGALALALLLFEVGLTLLAWCGMLVALYYLVYFTFSVFERFSS